MVSKKPKVAPSVKLDLGCGQNKREGFIGVDKVQAKGVDKVWDLTKTPWPWKNESVDEICSSHFLEHLESPQRIKFMEECWRILKADGKLQIIVPSGTNERFFQDPTHKWPPIVPASMLYFNKEWLKQNKLDHQHDYKADFNFNYGFNMNPTWASRSEEARSFAIAHYYNVVSDLIFNLVKIEG